MAWLYYLDWCIEIMAQTKQLKVEEGQIKAGLLIGSLK